MENPEAIRLAYYKLKIKSTEFDVFDLVRAIQEKVPFSFELATALKYIIRIKSDAPEKRINDMEKAAECLNREIEYLKANCKVQPETIQSLPFKSVLFYEAEVGEKLSDAKRKCIELSEKNGCDVALYFNQELSLFKINNN